MLETIWTWCAFFGCSTLMLALGTWAIKQTIRQIREIAYEGTISKEKIGKGYHNVLKKKVKTK